MVAPDLRPLELGLDLSELERAVRPSARERLGWRAQSARRWLRRNAVDLLVLACCVTVALVVHMHGMYDTPARFDDEGTYTAYAWAVEYEGKLGHYTYWYAHPPLGWIQMAFWNWITGGFRHAPYAIASVRAMMVVSKAVSVVLVYVLALRLRMTRVGAAAAVVIFALSPLAVYFTRTALLDNVVTPWLLASFVLAASRRRALATAAGCAACLAMAVLSKETALLFLPALALLFWQCSDARNRKFTITLASSTFALLVMLYPAYALVKNEFFQGKGHVSLLWAIQWQLFDRQGSGSIFNAKSTAHAVASSWVIQDPWLTRLAVVLVVPALLFRRTRAVALAFGIQLVELLRSGYLPYPFVVAMIPFGALTIAGVADRIWQGADVPVPARWRRNRVLAWLARDRCADRSALAPPGDPRWLRPVTVVRSRLRGMRHAAAARWARSRTLLCVLVRGSIVAATLVLLLAMQSGWTARIHDLWFADHDRGAAAALSWVRSNVAPTQWIVVDDAFWVDLVRHGFEQRRTIWFTKLDVDPSVKIPARPAWKGIDYVVLTYQDEMSLHLTLDDEPTTDTRSSFPTVFGALSHSQIVGRFGSGADRVTIWRVLPGIAAHHAGGPS